MDPQKVLKLSKLKIFVSNGRTRKLFYNRKIYLIKNFRVKQSDDKCEGRTIHACCKYDNNKEQDTVFSRIEISEDFLFHENLFSWT